MSGGEQATAIERAEATLDAIRRPRRYSRSRRLYGRRRWPAPRSYEHLWPFATAWSAVATLSGAGSAAAAAALEDFPAGLGAYRRGAQGDGGGSEEIGFESSVVPPLGAGGDRFFDDNAWVGLAAVRHYDLTGDARLLRLARRVLAFVTSGWSEEPGWEHPGGIRWKEAPSHRSRNTCSNGPAAELAALVHERTGDPEPLEQALRIYRWVRAALRRGDLYADRIAPDGAVEPTVWTYNQGTMIGAGLLLSRLTGQDAYLDHAVATASAASRRFTLADLRRQGNAVYFRNLLLLDGVAPDPAYRAGAAAYAEAMWDEARDPRTGLFPREGSFLAGTAPMIQIYALLAGAPAHP